MALDHGTGMTSDQVTDTFEGRISRVFRWDRWGLRDAGVKDGAPAFGPRDWKAYEWPEPGGWL